MISELKEAEEKIAKSTKALGDSKNELARLAEEVEGKEKQLAALKEEIAKLHNHKGCLVS